mmetsp:Transcript_24511/g.62883  ORF Transcript_24511/g.62883 Transcript_24511/m.62883 type:complete len:137 (+) Transcript_24511:57-467(+)
MDLVVAENDGSAPRHQPAADKEFDAGNAPTMRRAGHYILAYILGRRAFVPPDGAPSRTSRATGGPNAGTGARQRSRARPRAGVPGGGRNRPARPPRARASERSASGGGAALGPEILVVVALVAAYNYVLLTYGLDY